MGIRSIEMGSAVSGGLVLEGVHCCKPVSSMTYETFVLSEEDSNSGVDLADG